MTDALKCQVCKKLINGYYYKENKQCFHLECIDEEVS